MTSRSRLSLLATLVVALLGAGVTGFSSATYTTRTTNQVSIGAASDWTPPTVAMSSPGSSVSGTVSLSATASDADSGVASVAIQYAATGTTAWTTVCTRTAAPYSCSWDTRAVADGDYDLRARATDNAGYSATSPLLTTRVVNNVAVVLTLPGDVLRGTVTVSAAVKNTPVPPTTLRIERRLGTSTGSWTTICSNTLMANLSCSWDTSGLASDLYSVRAVTSVAGTTYTDTRNDVLVDNTAPTVTLTDPGSPISGSRVFSATAIDDDSGVATVQLQHKPASGSTWTTMCTLTAEPYSCRFDTRPLADGNYDFRAQAVDVAGNTGTSASLRRAVNNTVTSATMDDPGALLTGTVTLTADGTSSNGVASLAIQRAVAGSGTWVTICTVTTSPYSCPWNTTTVPDGSYDLRAVMTDTKGVQATSTVVAARGVDNSPLRGVDVQAVNGGTTAGRIDAGDQLVYTFSERVATGTVLAGWSGTGQSVTARLSDGRLVGLSGSQDVVTVETASGATVNLGSVNLRANYVKKNKAVLFTSSSITASTAVVDGVQRTVVTLTFGTPSSSTDLQTTTASVAMTWTPSAQVRSLNNEPCSVAVVTESGALDRDF